MPNSQTSLKVIKFLSKYKFGNTHNILKESKISDTFKLQRSLNFLKKNSLISIYTYEKYQFYFLSKEKRFVEEKIARLPNLIKTIIRESGPLTTKELSNHIRGCSYLVGIRFISQFLKDLANESIIFFKKKGLMRIYYDPNNESQLFELKKLLKSTREEQINITCNHYYNEIISRNLSFEQVKQLKRLWDENHDLIFSFNSTGRIYLDLVCVLHEFYTKRKIYSYVKSEASFEEMEIWLSINHVITEINQTVFQGLRRKIYRSFAKEILKDPLFGRNIKEKKEIFQTPKFFLKIRFLLGLFGFDNIIKQSILEYLQKSISNGFVIDGKTPKGILGGAIHIISTINDLGSTQRQIMEILNTNLVTLNIRKKELLKVNST